MKKILIGLATAAAIAAPVASIIACGSTANSVAVTSLEKVPAFVGTKITNKKLGAIVSDPENPRWQKSKNYLQKNGTAAGFATATSIVKAAADQKTWITANLSKIDALIVGATDDSVAGSWATWKDATKPVIAYDRLIKNNSNAYNWYVTYNNSLVGELQAKNILAAVYGEKSLATKDEKDIIAYVKAHKLSKEKSIISVAGDPADNNAGLFFNGATKLIDDVMKEDSHFVWADKVFDNFNNVAQDKWDYAKGQSFLQSKITNIKNKSEISAVLSPNDGMATAAINALKNNALDPKTIYITGQDSNDTAIISIFGGTGQDMTISKPDSQATAVAVGLAKYLVQHSDKNVKPGTAIDTATQKAILDAIKADFGNIEMLYDATSYEISAGNPINTILLTPKVVDKDNLDHFFKVTKK